MKYCLGLDLGVSSIGSAVLGFDIAAPINRLCRRYVSDRLTPATGEGTLYGILAETDDKTGLAKSIRQIILN